MQSASVNAMIILIQASLPNTPSDTRINIIKQTEESNSSHHQGQRFPRPERDGRAMRYHIGIDLGGTNIAAGVVDEDFRLLAKAGVPTRAGRSPDEIVYDMIETAKEAAAKAGIPFTEFTSLGVGMPSYVNPKTHLLVHSNNLGWKNLPIYDYFEKYTDLPVYIENDANCAVLGETLAGAAGKCKNVIMLTLGTGVGGGIILDNKVYAGADLLGAELGHIKLVYDGVLCSCGQKGCLESYCSATALIRQAKEAAAEEPGSLLYQLCNGQFDKINGEMIFQAKREGDRIANELTAQYTDYLAAGISTFITIFRPEMIILGGGIAEAGELLFDSLNEKIRENTFAAAETGVPLAVKARLGNHAGIIGAAFLEAYASKR